MNFQTTINLLKMKAKVLTIGGEPCVCLPIRHNDIYMSVNDDGSPKSAYITLNHWETKDGANTYGDTHLVKQKHSKAYLEQNGEQKSEPIIGNSRPIETKEKESTTVAAPVVAATEEIDWNNDLPF